MRDEQSSYLALDSEGEGEDALKDLQGHSIRYRIAVGPHKGRQAFKLQSLPPLTGERAGEPVAQVAGFSLHAGVAAEAHQKNKLESGALYHATAGGDRTALAHAPGYSRFVVVPSISRQQRPVPVIKSPQSPHQRCTMHHSTWAVELNDARCKCPCMCHE